MKTGRTSKIYKRKLTVEHTMKRRCVCSVVVGHASLPRLILLLLILFSCFGCYIWTLGGRNQWQVRAVSRDAPAESEQLATINALSRTSSEASQVASVYLANNTNPLRPSEAWLISTYDKLFQMKCSDGTDVRQYLHIETRNNKRVLVSDCILGIPGSASITASTPFLNPVLEEPYLRLPENANYKDTVVILTILRDAEAFLDGFASQLNSLTYPHYLIKVFLAEEGSSDNTYRLGDAIARKLHNEYGFSNSSIFKLPISGNNVTRADRHRDSIQISRRSHMAKARNMLVKLAVTDEKWVLWIDVDVIKIRPDTIQQFLFSDKDVMVASTLCESMHLDAVSIRTYDLNCFNEAVINGQLQKLYSNDFKAAGRTVPIQFVGACVLMIKSECIHKGLRFPESVIRSPGSLVNAIESEGLGLLARQMGFGVFVLPFLEAFHL